MTAIQGILLAAGSGRRFGCHKLLHPLASGELMGIAAARNLITALPNTLAIIRPDDHQLAERFDAMGLKVVENGQPEQGMGRSLALGIGSSAAAAGWVVALADMPWIAPQTILTVAHELKRGASLVAPVFQGRRGHPVGFGQKWRGPLQALRDDHGARHLLATHPHELVLLPTDDRGILLDIDHHSDLNPLS
ncbi:MAG: nucleotidyltransferase family protein [Candidatus Thiodiazotropha sp. (ex Dulcina madagascariensis)]|nr:nucleotidyltransferase family protein [Candidatus Thiodiazotropha sp. (ex Dulcina madagascariensis)]MCU7928811.1 nucleotidyltransferase family protein [Candidatus Thiodiazotropha sp. (ex Dulcina madagascariensis)]